MEPGGESSSEEEELYEGELRLSAGPEIVIARENLPGGIQDNDEDVVGGDLGHDDYSGDVLDVEEMNEEEGVNTCDDEQEEIWAGVGQTSGDKSDSSAGIIGPGQRRRKRQRVVLSDEEEDMQPGRGGVDEGTTGNDAEDGNGGASGQEDAVPGWRITDEEFMAGFDLLSELGNEQVWVDSLVGRPVDVDRWELCLTPNEYLRRFKDVLAEIEVVNNINPRPLHTTFHRGPAFDKYLLLAKLTHQIWINPIHKARIFEVLKGAITIEPGTHPTQSSQGTHRVGLPMIIDALNEAGCLAMRIKSYGQKRPLTDQFTMGEPAEEGHIWAEHNEWDIGQTFNSPYIWLFACASGRHWGINRFPMMIPGSRDYGSVNITLKHQQQKFEVKIYPRIVHVIKSINSKMPKTVPRTLAGIKKQGLGALAMIHALSAKDGKELGGFRIEVTVRAKTLAEAKARVERTGFLDPKFWLGVGDGTHYRYPFDARLIDTKSYLDGARWMYQRATECKVFEGAAGTKPTNRHIKAITDVLNAVGWNPGLRSPSLSLDPNTWFTNAPNVDRSLLDILCETYRTDKEIKGFFNHAKTITDTIGLPCIKYPNNQKHRFQVNDNVPFKIRCCVDAKNGCGKRLTRAAILGWIAQLVKDGRIQRENLNLDADVED